MKASEFIRAIISQLDILKEIYEDDNYDPEVIILKSPNNMVDIKGIGICERFNDDEEKIYIANFELDN